MKSKKAKTNQSAELKFVSTLELDQSVDLIAQLGEQYPVVLTVRNPDTIDFNIRYANGEIDGTLQRWAGNETRINCTGEVPRIEYGGKGLDEYVSPIAQVFGVGFCLVAISTGNAALGAVGLASLFRFGSWFRPKHAQRRKTLVPLFRERDAIFQQIIDSFKSWGDVYPL